MKNLIKWWGITIFVVVIGFSMIACEAGAEGGSWGKDDPNNPDNATYTLRYELTSDGTGYRVSMEVNGWNEEGFEVTIPEIYNSIPVKEIGNMYAAKSIAIPASVVTIGEYAFNSSPLSIIIFAGDGKLQTIRYGAFDGCTRLTSITLPETVTQIGNNAFSGCTGLTGITLPANLTVINYETFSGCTGLTTITIPANVTEIGERAFSGNSKLTTVTLSGSKLRKIGSFAFATCALLTNINLPATVTEIGQAAFTYCRNLPAITIPANVTVIGENAFYGCVALVNVTFGGGSKLEKIEKGAFSGCERLVYIAIPDSVTYLGVGVFEDSINLGTVTFTGSSKLAVIDDKAFSGCVGITSIVLPDDVIYVGAGVFKGWKATQAIQIPSTTIAGVYNLFPANTKTVELLYTDSYGNSYYSGQYITGWSQQWRSDCNAIIKNSSGQAITS